MPWTVSKRQLTACIGSRCQSNSIGTCKRKQSRHNVHINQGMFRTLIQREEANIINLLILPQLETPVYGLRLLWQHHEHCLEHTGHTLTASTKSLGFKGNLPSLAICRSICVWWWPLFLCTQSTASAEGSAVRFCTQGRASASWLPGIVSTL